MIRVTIVGVGLIGGSMGMSLRRQKKSGKRKYLVTGFGRSVSSLRLAKKLGAVDEFSINPAKAFSKADVVVLCVPVPKIVPVLRGLLPHLKSGTIVTDVGSVKKSVVDDARRALSKRPDISFVGAHPIAGSEKTGVRFSQKDLFQKSTCVLIKDNVPFNSLKMVKDLWQSVGASCVLLEASSHDHWLAMTSHLPHLLAFSLFSLVRNASQKNPIVARLAGGSFRDMTRIAGADPDLWTGILKTNRIEIKKAIGLFLRELNSRLP